MRNKAYLLGLLVDSISTEFMDMMGGLCSTLDVPDILWEGLDGQEAEVWILLPILKRWKHLKLSVYNFAGSKPVRVKLCWRLAKVVRTYTIVLEMSLEILPCEILSQIVQYLPVDSLLNGLALVSTQFYYLVQDELKRLKIDMEIDFDTYQTPQTQSLSKFNIGKLVLKNCANPYEFLSEVNSGWNELRFKNHDLFFLGARKKLLFGSAPVPKLWIEPQGTSFSP